MATTPDPLADPVARACRLNYLEFCREIARWSGAEGRVEERDGVVLWATASELPVSLNGVARLDPATPADAVIACADAWFGAMGRGYTVSAVDGADADLAGAAELAGLVVMRDNPQMVCRAPIAGPRPPEGVTLRWVDDPSGITHFARIVDESYQSLGTTPDALACTFLAPERMLEPHVETVLAVVDGDAVACAQVLWSHGMAGVYYVGTLEPFRGRGLAELVTRAVTERAFARGADVVGLQASPMGDPIYRRMGYEELYRQRGLVRFPTG